MRIILTLLLAACTQIFAATPPQIKSVGTHAICTGTYEDALRSTGITTLSAEAIQQIPALQDAQLTGCTLFVPTDDAWKKVLIGVENNSPEKKITAAAKILHYSIVPGKGLTRTQLLKKAVVQSIMGKFIVTTSTHNPDGTVTDTVRIKPLTTTATIVHTIFCPKGVIHIIDTVLPTN